MTESLYDIAIIGMNGRFPGAANLEQFWQNLRAGVESVTFFSDEDLLAAGVDENLLRHPHYVKARPFLSDIEYFDAPFWGINPREAEIMDPQQRIFLESTWHALEDAGYAPDTYPGRIGVYAGSSISTYLLNNLYTNRSSVEAVGVYQVMISNDKDFLATQTSYRLGLRGPSITIQTACSTSLVAVHMACQSLLNHECDMALAGGVSVTVPQRVGYLYTPQGIASPDGHCRPFDAQAQGTIGGDGVGVVVLKRLGDALADGDVIQAVIKGSAVNNDGNRKIGYTAPSEEGQVEVITEALTVAAVDPRTITYVETHGTGTILGDPIEVAALTNVFRTYTPDKGFCAIGSVKSNIGHLDAAAGVAGLIKTVLALKHQELPPSLHFTRPNPAIDFANSPVYVNAHLQPWPRTDAPRRAGVSSFGIGGTNAHVIVEEAPVLPPAIEGESPNVLLLSARTEAALDKMASNLVVYWQQQPDLNLADVVYTLQVGRSTMAHRRTIAAQTSAAAIAALEAGEGARGLATSGYRPLFFLFPGQGTQYVNMGRGLYEQEPVFQAAVDRCAAWLMPHLGFDLRGVLYPDDETAVSTKLHQTAVTQPALFVVEYALAQLWLSWGIAPQAMMGHSIGEYVAACLAGVFILEDVLWLVVQRGQKMQQLPGGAMLSVALSETRLKPYLTEELSLAAVNAPHLCVVSGTYPAIETLQQQLAQQGIGCRRLHTSHAFHSAMMEPVLAEFAAAVRQVKRTPPTIPFISNLTGTWITAEAATDPVYWANHLRQPVRFADGVRTLLGEEDAIWLEVGPGHTLSTLVQQQNVWQISSSLPHSQDTQTDEQTLWAALGRLWTAGLDIKWPQFYRQEQRRRVSLPGYPFERERYWVEPGTPTTTQLTKKQDIADWFYLPSWQQSRPVMSETNIQGQVVLLFADERGIGDQLTTQLKQKGVQVVKVRAGQQFQRHPDEVYTIRPNYREDYDKLSQEVHRTGQSPRQVIHLWSVTAGDEQGIEFARRCLSESFYSLVFLVQAMSSVETWQLTAVSNHVYDVTGNECLQPEKAVLVGLCRVIGQEYSHITCRQVDILTSETTWMEPLLAEITTHSTDRFLAYRGRHRWIQTFLPVRLEGGVTNRLRSGGTYLITGGLGGIGWEVARYLAQTVQANLILIGRSAFPDRATWAQWLEHPETPIADKIRKVQALESLGVRVLILQADVTSLLQMETAVALARQQVGDIHGVFHAAGIAGGGVLALKTPEMADPVLAPKVIGTLVLEAVFKHTALDIFVLFSSLASVLGGLGQADYCAANTFLDAFAHRKTAENPHCLTLSINWDTWQEVGMAVQAPIPWPEAAAHNGRQGIFPAEGIEALNRMLTIGPVPQWVVSTHPLQPRLEQSQVIWQSLQTQNEGHKPSHRRPNFQTRYTPPENPLQEELVHIWQQLLGVTPIGIHDNFLELGGHSLLATQLMSRIQETFQVQIPLRRFFESPTIADMALHVAQAQLGHSVGDQNLETLLSEVESLSLEEMARFLSQETQD